MKRETRNKKFVCPYGGAANGHNCFYFDCIHKLRHDCLICEKEVYKSES